MLVLMDGRRTLNNFPAARRDPQERLRKRLAVVRLRLFGAADAQPRAKRPHHQGLVGTAARLCRGHQPQTVPPARGGNCVDGAQCAAFLQGSVVAIADLEVEPRADGPRKTAQRFGYRSIVSVSVVVRSRIIGVLNCYLREPHEYTPDELTRSSSSSRRPAVAIETSRIAAEQRQAVVELRARASASASATKSWRSCSRPSRASPASWRRLTAPSWGGCGGPGGRDASLSPGLRS